MAAGLIDGKPEVIHPIMHWALQRLPDLKKRAYLANFLMTIDVPDEFLQNDEVAETREQVRYHSMFGCRCLCLCDSVSLCLCVSVCASASV